MTSFTENLLRKIEINRLAQYIRTTVGPVGSMVKVDKTAMERLLGYAGYTRKEERELVLYLKPDENGKDRILALDNDLNIYETHLEDVLLRKNPTVKEMISIRNAIKILNDKDVVVSKKEQTVRLLEAEAVSLLDLSYNQADIQTIAADGCRALAEKDTEKVLQAIDLFSELLHYHAPPSWLRLGRYTVRGGLSEGDNRMTTYGPVVIFDAGDNRIVFVDDRVGMHEKEKVDWVRRIALGREKADVEGEAVFLLLQKEVPAVRE